MITCLGRVRVSVGLTMTRGEIAEAIDDVVVVVVDDDVVVAVD